MEYHECLLYRDIAAPTFRVYVFWQENIDALIHTGKDIPAQKPLSFFADRRGMPVLGLREATARCFLDLLVAINKPQ